MNQLEDLDLEVQTLLTKYMGRDAELAIDTYKLGLHFRGVAVDRYRSQTIPKKTKVRSLLENELVMRVVLLLAASIIGSVFRSNIIALPVRRLLIK